MKNIYIEAEEAWDYAVNHQDELAEKEELLAEDEDFGISVHMSIEEGIAEDILITFMVFQDDDEIYMDFCENAEECQEALKYIYNKYLSGNINEFMDLGYNDYLEKNDCENDTEENIDDAILSREMELDDAVADLLDIVAPNFLLEANCDDGIDRLKDLICEHLYTDFNISVYRPMFLENEDGEDEFFEYPYEEMEIE